MTDGRTSCTDLILQLMMMMIPQPGQITCNEQNFQHRRAACTDTSQQVIMTLPQLNLDTYNFGFM